MFYKIISVSVNSDPAEYKNIKIKYKKTKTIKEDLKKPNITMEVIKIKIKLRNIMKYENQKFKGKTKLKMSKKRTEEKKATSEQIKEYWLKLTLMVDGRAYPYRLFK